MTLTTFPESDIPFKMIASTWYNHMCQMPTHNLNVTTWCFTCGCVVLQPLSTIFWSIGSNAADGEAFSHLDQNCSDWLCKSLISKDWQTCTQFLLSYVTHFKLESKLRGQKKCIEFLMAMQSHHRKFNISNWSSNSKMKGIRLKIIFSQRNLLAFNILLFPHFIYKLCKS